MILADVKPEAKASSPLGITLPKEEPTLSFSELLRGAKDTKGDKEIQNGSFVLSLGAEEKNSKATPKKETFLSLLSNKDIEASLETIEINPKITQGMTVTELKTLIFDAKQFLKEQILNTEGYKRAQIGELPKSLKGLAQLAKGLGIDLQKISLEEVQSQGSKAGAQLLEVDEKLKLNTKDEGIKTELSRGEHEDKSLKAKGSKAQQDAVKEVKSTALFKAQEKVEYTTEQLVQTKQFKVEEKTPKSRADETLKLLLRGEKPGSDASVKGMTADFSVATAKVIAPEAKTEVTKSFEQLLRGEPDESTSKTDGLTANKADNLDVKLNEAKQMVKYLSQDVKTAIEDYKSPFTRVKVQLNPAKMGEVDITVVTRGKNLHVNISSNTAAINTLAMNSNDLKVQLNSNGIQNASLNFSNQGGNESGQQQHRQNERQAHEEYNYFEEEEQNEEILSSLEIVVPNYV